jgi:phosphoribosylformylglycinamidine synthase
MLWEVEIQPRETPPELERVRQEYDLLTHQDLGRDLLRQASRGYLLEGELEHEQVTRLVNELLYDRLVEHCSVALLDDAGTPDGAVTVLPRPGVMDPVAQSVSDAALNLGITLASVRTFRRYYLNAQHPPEAKLELLFSKVLANEAVEEVVRGRLSAQHLGFGASYQFQRLTVPIRELDEGALVRLSREGQLSLSLAEMKSIQTHFRCLSRDPTDVELETLAQTWSEHCSHKTLKGRIEFQGRHYDNLLKETVFAATQQIRQRLGADDWCVSVFEDNAGVVRFDDKYHVCFKVETHNHPSAIEPYGGANTGLGGVIRDALGTGLGARPICNTDVFCFAPPDLPVESLPVGVLHPRKVMRGVVAGVRDYGNRMGIPTVNGAVCFDERYLANPLVFCGTVGLIPVNRSRKEPRAADLIVAVGGRTGRDGIHGATFSSTELTAESERVSGGAVQIGNAITEKKLLDVLLQARDLGFYHALTDCGAGGFSSAVGEMGEKTGATVELDRAPLKYQGLSYTEIWISEAQERMVLAVPPDKWPRLQQLCAGEDVEATVIGRFEPTGRLRLLYQGQQVADLDMHFLHHGRPPVIRQASAPLCAPCDVGKLTGEDAEERRGGHSGRTTTVREANLTDVLLKILASHNVCSKEWIIRQYDHEVQGGTIIKPLVGQFEDGPGDAAVITPVLGSRLGLAIGCGINPRYGDLDPYQMAAAAVDEAVRNVVTVGADPARIALLDNFCWGNTDRPEVLGSLVRAAQACRDVALAYGTPFISGKDSLNNEFHAEGRHIVIPPTLLISALGRIPDVHRAVTMDLKEPGNLLFLLGETRNEMGGSHFNLVNGLDSGVPPQVDLEQAPRTFQCLHQAMQQGLIRSCHDLSEGGLAVAVAEMAFAGALGADLRLAPVSPQETDEVLLFSESTSRFVVEVSPANVAALQSCLADQVPCVKIGESRKEARLRIAGAKGEWIIWAKLADLKEAWQKPLRW